MMFGLLFNININAQTKTDTVVVSNTITITSDTTYDNTEFVRDPSFKSYMFKVNKNATLTLKNSTVDSAEVTGTSSLFFVEGTLNIENVMVNNYYTASGSMFSVGGSKATDFYGELNVDGLNVNNANATGAAAPIFKYQNELKYDKPLIINNFNMKDSTFGAIFSKPRIFKLTNSNISNNKLNYIFTTQTVTGINIIDFEMENTVLKIIQLGIQLASFLKIR